MSSTESERGLLVFTFDILNIPLAEFDIGGVLYHSRYFALYEQTREAFLRQIGLPYPELVKSQQHLAVTESFQKFLRPVRYGEKLTVRMYSSDVRRSSFTLSYEISRHEDSEPIHLASTIHAFVAIDREKKQERFRLTPLPEKLRSSLLTSEQSTSLSGANG